MYFGREVLTISPSLEEILSEQSLLTPHPQLHIPTPAVMQRTACEFHGTLNVAWEKPKPSLSEFALAARWLPTGLMEASGASPTEVQNFMCIFY